MADPTPVQSKFYKTSVNGIDSYQVATPKDAANEQQLFDQGFTSVTKDQYLTGLQNEATRIQGLASKNAIFQGDAANALAAYNDAVTKYGSIAGSSTSAGDSGMVTDANGRFTDLKTLANEKDPNFLTPEQFKANNDRLAGMTQKQIYDQSAAANPSLASANPYKAPGTTYNIATNTPQTAQTTQGTQYYSPAELRSMMNYKIPGIADSVTSPDKLANSAYVNALFKEQFGRDATAAELAKFGQMSVKDAANIVLRDRSPFLPVGQAFTGNTTPRADFKVDVPSTFDAKTVSAAFDGSTPSGADISNTLGVHASNTAAGMGLEIQNALDRQAAARAALMGALNPGDAEKQLQNSLVDIHKQIDDTTLQAQAGLNKIQSQAIPMEPLIGQGAVLQRQANLVLNTLSAQEKNLTERLGLAQDNRKAQLTGLQALVEYANQDIDMAFKMKDAIAAKEQRTFDNAMKLQDNARASLITVLGQFKGLDFSDLNHETQMQLQDWATKAGIPIGLISSGMETVKDQLLFDQNLKTKDQTLKELAQNFDQRYKTEQLTSDERRIQIEAERLALDRQKALGTGSGGSTQVNGTTYTIASDGSVQSVRDPKETQQQSDLNDLIDLTVDLSTHPGLSSAVGLKGASSLFGLTGIPFIGNGGKPLAGTQAADFVAKLDTLKAKLSLENIAKLKGTGAITDREEQMLQDASSSLNTNTSEAAFKAELQRLEQTFRDRLDNTSYSVGKTNVGDDTKKVAAAIGQFESGNNYQALGPVTGNGDRAYGKYQVMGNNIPSWTKTAIGKSLTPQQFLANPQAQDAVAHHYMGNLLDKYGNVGDVASVWFSGKPLAQAGNAQDVIGTSVPKYVKSVVSIFNQLS